MLTKVLRLMYGVCIHVDLDLDLKLTRETMGRTVCKSVTFWGGSLRDAGRGPGPLRCCSDQTVDAGLG